MSKGNKDYENKNYENKNYEKRKFYWYAGTDLRAPTHRNELVLTYKTIN